MSRRTGALNKRFQSDVYTYLLENGEKTSQEITEWWNTRDLKYHVKNKRTKNTTVKNTVTCIRAAGVLSRSILFEKVRTQNHRYDLGTNTTSVWDVRPFEDCITRAIKSRKEPSRFPMFVAEELRRRLEEC